MMTRRTLLGAAGLALGGAWCKRDALAYDGPLLTRSGDDLWIGDGKDHSRMVVTGHRGNIGERMLYLGSRGIDKRDGPDSDLAEPGPWLTKLVGATTVLHLAASPGRDWPDSYYLRNNFQATAVLLSACAQICPEATVVFASTVGISAASFGAPPTVPCGPDGLYGQSKVYGEHLLAHYCRERLIRAGVSVRIGYAPPTGTAVVPGAWAETIRMETVDLARAFNAAFDAARIAGPQGYSVHNPFPTHPTTCSQDVL